MTATECSPFHAVANALAADARRQIAKARAEDAARMIGAQGVTIDFYDRREADKPISDGSMVIRGREVSWAGSRWAAWLVRWDGRRWKRTRRLSGPLQFTDALDRASELCRKRSLPRVE